MVGVRKRKGIWRLSGTFEKSIGTLDLRMSCQKKKTFCAGARRGNREKPAGEVEENANTVATRVSRPIVSPIGVPHGDGECWGRISDPAGDTRLSVARGTKGKFLMVRGGT